MRRSPSAKAILTGVAAVSLALVVLSTTRISTAWLFAARMIVGVAHASS